MRFGPGSISPAVNTYLCLKLGVGSPPVITILKLRSLITSGQQMPFTIPKLTAWSSSFGKLLYWHTWEQGIIFDGSNIRCLMLKINFLLFNVLYLCRWTQRIHLTLHYSRWNLLDTLHAFTCTVVVPEVLATESFCVYCSILFLLYIYWLLCTCMHQPQIFISI